MAYVQLRRCEPGQRCLNEFLHSRARWFHPIDSIEGTRLKIGPIEAFDGTPVVDIKSASTRAGG